MADQQQEQPQGGEFTKVEQQFTQTFRKFVALIQGEENLSTQKVSTDMVSAVVGELLQEEREAARVKFKEEVKQTMHAYQKFTKEVAEAKKQYEQNVTSKRKEFIKKMQDSMQGVQDMKEVEKSYYEGLSMVATGTVPDPEPLP